MKTIVLTAAAIATMLSLASTEAMALRVMSPEVVDVDKNQGLTIIGGKAPVRLAPIQSELQQLYATDVPAADTVRTEIAPTTNIFADMRQFLLELIR
ncbi:MAG: hypothetical protein K8R48_06390 [Alphaproteobacteria bacterium]|nr:hypothetical protein [Alphaproteobacteria bacterium]